MDETAGLTQGYVVALARAGLLAGHGGQSADEALTGAADGHGDTHGGAVGRVYPRVVWDGEEEGQGYQVRSSAFSTKRAQCRPIMSG